MIPLSSNALAKIVGGLHHGEQVEVTGNGFFDTRKPETGGIFFAFKGENTDGHLFLREAKNSGAAVAIVEEINEELEFTQIKVANVNAALDAIAIHVRASLPNLTVIGITGSQGKTTVKDMLGQVLSEFGPTISPIGSFNNELGVPITILRCNSQTKYLVLEMGARHRGEIRKLASMSNLNIAIVLCVGQAHLGEFGSVQQIFETKREIVECTPKSGDVILGTYDPLTPTMAGATGARVLTFGPEGIIQAKLLSMSEGAASIEYRGKQGRLGFLGKHQISNAEAVLATIEVLDLDEKRGFEALISAKPQSRWRMEKILLESGATLLCDFYNANPESMASAVLSLSNFSDGLETWAVLGEMRELGEASLASHQMIGRLVFEQQIDHLVGVGTYGKVIVEAAQELGHPSAHWSETKVEAADYLKHHLSRECCVLLKASRGEKFEEIAKALGVEV